MNRIMLFLLFSLFFSCQKNEPQSLLTGEWQWVQAQGGIAGITIKANENLQKTLILGASNEYVLVENGKNTINTKYQILKKKSIFSGKDTDMLVLNGLNGFYMSYFVSSDSLFISDEVYDGFTNSYVRKK